MSRRRAGIPVEWAIVAVGVITVVEWLVITAIVASRPLPPPPVPDADLARVLETRYGPGRNSEDREEWIVRDFFQDRRDGVFVDIGVKQDGLVHISQLSNTYVSDPNEVVKLQQKVMVTVVEVDIARKRISLSMKGNKAPAAKPQSGGQRPAPAKGPAGKGDVKDKPLDPFQAKLMELKKKFKD